MKKPVQGAPQHSVTATATMGGHAKPAKQHRVSATATMGPKGSGSKKHSGGKKHTAKRGWSPGADVACCSAEALGLLLGWDHSRVLDLYWRTCSGPDEGASIADTLAAANFLGAVTCGNVTTNINNRRSAYWPGSMLLGCLLPEPHAVAVTPDGRWWSWGEPFDPAAWPELVIDEAWALWP